ncbi:3-keto-disaccharide hydrolase [Cognaticolwellia mytili]|jgi:hypothetical protein|uniref:3-keto-disaccharide hydrolase n=1 Tax=Cognaticolwellia mytili TaxID=1888913 RepID=UPI000A17399C|nr:DUF1080 domain-containing protein [Cognaticolwellia mytili]
MNKLTFSKKSVFSVIKTSFLLFFISTPILASAHDNTLTKEEKSQGWQLLFNGKDMSQWRNFKKETISNKWQVQQGEMRLSEKGAGDILTKEKYENFDFTLDWKISIAGNSGIFIMADESGSQIYSHAVEVQILDNERHSDNKLASHLSGSIYDITASPVKSHKPAGEWNTVRIRMFNKSLKVWQNDVLTADVVVGSEKWQQLVAKSKFKNWQGFALTDVGHIGLQDHNDTVAFKNIKIKTL